METRLLYQRSSRCQHRQTAPASSAHPPDARLCVGHVTRSSFYAHDAHPTERLPFPFHKSANWEGSWLSQATQIAGGGGGLHVLFACPHSCHPANHRPGTKASPPLHPRNNTAPCCHLPAACSAQALTARLLQPGPDTNRPGISEGRWPTLAGPELSVTVPETQEPRAGSGSHCDKGRP